MTKRIFIAIITTLLVSNCTNTNFQKAPEEQFVGVWELHGRSMFNGIKIKIDKNDRGKLIGRIINGSLNFAKVAVCKLL
jgi:predicted RNA-binding protein YlqC (UPF0109 family)